MVSWDVATAAAQTVHEMWEPEAHSQLEWGGKGPRALADATIPVTSPGVFTPELSLGLVDSSWSLGFVNRICADPSIV